MLILSIDELVPCSEMYCVKFVMFDIFHGNTFTFLNVVNCLYLNHHFHTGIFFMNFTKYISTIPELDMSSFISCFV